MLAGHPLHASALVDLSCWPHGLEGSTVFELTGPFYPCVSMPQPRPSVVRGRGCAGTQGLLGGEQEILHRAWWSVWSPQSHLSPLRPLTTSSTEEHQARRKQAVCGDIRAQGRCNKDSLLGPLLQLVKKKLLFFSKETDSDHLTVGNYSNTEDAST